MKGLVLYNKADLEAGPVFAERLIRHGREMGFDMTLARKEDLCRTVREGKLLLLLDGQPLSLDFALNRTRDSYLGALLEGQGIRVFNNVQTTFVANDKFSSYNQARKLGIPAVRTERFFPTAEKAPYFPCVIKSASGHGGAEVSLIAGPEDFAAWKASEVGQRRGPSAGCVLQPFVPHAHDVRVFVLGGEKALPGLMERYGLTLVVETLGDRGAVGFFRGERISVSGRSARCVDATGAGDAFWGGLLSMLRFRGVTAAEELTAPLVREAIAYGNVGGWLCVQGMGAIPSLPTRREIERHLA